MVDLRYLLKPGYSNSHALIIGIDQYKYAPPLGYAVSDANAVSSTLQENFHFPHENVKVLKDEHATKNKILEALYSYQQLDMQMDDRLLVFFAGHGATQKGLRGDIGFLVPYEGNIKNLGSLIRWAEFTAAAEVLAAKHVLFIMDACYGGLAVNRNVKAGDTRFAHDMTKRFARQALAAGKPDEVVADSGGPRPNHSVFTGHLLNGLDGAAADNNGMMTANMLMNYVCMQVAQDRNSNQTPHYGYLDGDGDFIFTKIVEQSDEKTPGESPQITIPEFNSIDLYDGHSDTNYIKRLLSDNKSTIELHDHLLKRLRVYLSQSGNDNFSVDVPFSDEELARRLSAYDELSRELTDFSICLGYWSQENQRSLLEKLNSRVIDYLRSSGGLVAWLALRWYPVLRIFYAQGIASVASSNYRSLYSSFYTRVESPENQEIEPFVKVISEGWLELSRSSIFNHIPDLRNRRTPISDHMYSLLQPTIDEILFTGSGYEQYFSEFEIFYALCIAFEEHKKDPENLNVWFPAGRFAWQNRYQSGSLKKIVKDAERHKDDWPPLLAGFFGGSISEFRTLTKIVSSRIERLGWY